MSNPPFAAANSAYLASTYAETRRKYIAGFIGGAYLRDLFSFQLRLSLLLSATGSTLLSAVRHVVFLCAEKKVFWIAARSVVATMKNIQAIWYRSFVKRPRQAMCKPSSYLASGTFANDSVTEPADLGFLPLPAASRFVNLETAMKPLGKRQGFFHLISKFRTGNSSYYTSLGDK